MTPGQLLAIMPRCPAERADPGAAALTAALVEAECSTVTRAAAFVAQIAWETGSLRFLIEQDGGLRYEGRHDLGNIEPGDGPRFRGRGLIQITGRRNYQRYGERLGLDLVAQPERAAELSIAGRVAALYWLDHACGALADARDFRGITEEINGAASNGPPSYHDRREGLYRTALEVLGITALVV